MGKDAQSKAMASAEVQKKVQECVEVLMAQGFGPEGPLKETTFAEMEDFGHEMGRMIAREIETRLAIKHQTHYEECRCPTCETLCPVKETVQRDFQTVDGKMPLAEVLCHCPVCDRDFFPSEDRSAN